MRPLVIVAGSGRSGTSLTMQMLHACGLQVSDDLTGASEPNPRGAWEDRAIFAEQARLFHSLAIRVLPRRDGWREGPLFYDVKSRLDQILADRLSKSGSVWGFKDPKTCFFLPMWQDLSKAHNCDLRFVLCVRRAEDTIASLMTNYDHSSDLAQSIYFNRNVHALADCPDRAFFIHYEDLLDRNVAMLRQLCCFCGLRAEQSDRRLTSIMAEICDTNLNRRGGSNGIDLAAPVQKLDQKLQALRGVPPDINQVRREARALLAPLQRWEFVIEAARTQIHDGETKTASARESCTREIERLQDVSQALIASIRERSSQEVEQLKRTNARDIATLKQSNTRLKAQADQKISVLRRQIRWLEIRQQELVTNQLAKDELQRKVGKAVLKTFERPGLPMIRLPWKLVRLYWKHRRMAARRATQHDT
jgi:hypothetical protein